jgi:hypothetical protein
MFVVQMDTLSLYIQGACPKVTEHWRLAIRNQIVKNGSLLHEQQLTSANVVVLVDLCANFVITNGMEFSFYYKNARENFHSLRISAKFMF